jgi:eukaryotic-like serine/threonine-protein kinase
MTGGGTRVPGGATVGDVLANRYRLERVLGAGATGIVFCATRQVDGRVVAVKIVRTELASDPYVRRRFEREARVALELRHPNLVPITDVGEDEGRDFLVMDFVRGRSLAERLSVETWLPVDAVVRLAEDIGGALDALHAGGVVHRDVKPGNILLAESGKGLLTDFGLARADAFSVLTQPSNPPLGTVAYMAPEMAMGRPYLPASDLYSLGCVVYECLGGGPPFSGIHEVNIALDHLHTPPPDLRERRPELAPALVQAVDAALEKEPTRRPPTGSAFARLLDAAVASSA